MKSSSKLGRNIARKHKIGDHVLVKLSVARIVEAEDKAVVEKSNLNVLSRYFSLALRTS